MKSGIWSPSKKNACALNEKAMGETKENGILKGIRGYVACISQIRRQKTN
jgi:hypothetical protein